MHGDFYIGGQKISGINFDNDTEFIPEVINKHRHIKDLRIEDLSLEYKIKDFDIKSFKKLFKLPRKKKKKIYGTRKARSRVIKRTERGLPLTKKDLERAGTGTTFYYITT